VGVEDKTHTDESVRLVGGVGGAGYMQMSWGSRNAGGRWRNAHQRAGVARWWCV
jgi:hypothetical protein